MLLPGASSRVDADIARVQNEIKALDRSITALQQQRSALSANLDALLAAKEKSDMSTTHLSTTPAIRLPAALCMSPVPFLSLVHVSVFHLTPMLCRDEISSRIEGEREWADAHGFPWSTTLNSMLRECFRLRSFRPGQLEAINCVSCP